MLFENFIEGGQIALKFFYDSGEFLICSETYRPELILTDIDMRFYDGKKLVTILHAKTKHFPTYFVSGYDALDCTLLLKELSI